ncbi:MAG: DUF192 domain-containing protein [Candidatus Liptonbacteria bacterium]|nr:DUF192 domain-containing protein [Candidatus Liptonbacteria bacterium]
MKNQIILYGALFAVLAVLALALAIASSSKNQEGDLPRGKFVISREGNNAVFDVEIAEHAFSLMRGLSGRERIGENKGMLFLFGMQGRHGIWMKEMKFPLDIIWIRNDRIVGVTENAVPEPGKSLLELTVYYPPEAVDKVLEVNAGVAHARGVRAGDAALLERAR